MSASTDEHGDAQTLNTPPLAEPRPATATDTTSVATPAASAAAPAAFAPPSQDDLPTTAPQGSTTADHAPPVPAPAAERRADAAPDGARRGDVTLNWRLLLGLAWVAAFFAYSAVWQASVQIGIGTWWLGPRAQPTSMLVRILPFLLCIAMALCALYNVRHLLRVNALGVGLAALIAVPDFSRSVGLGIAELVIAALLALVTAAATTGRYRLRPAEPIEPDAPLESPVVAGAEAERH